MIRFSQHNRVVTSDSRNRERWQCGQWYLLYLLLVGAIILCVLALVVLCDNVTNWHQCWHSDGHLLVISAPPPTLMSVCQQSAHALHWLNCLCFWPRGFEAARGKHTHHLMCQHQPVIATIQLQANWSYHQGKCKRFVYVLHFYWYWDNLEQIIFCGLWNKVICLMITITCYAESLQ